MACLNNLCDFFDPESLPGGWQVSRPGLKLPSYAEMVLLSWRRRVMVRPGMIPLKAFHHRVVYCFSGARSCGFVSSTYFALPVYMIYEHNGKKARF